MGFEGLKPTTNTEQQKPPKVEIVSDNQITYEKKNFKQYIQKSKQHIQKPMKTHFRKYYKE